jgi:uncharacterized C2H2 Zn-finger protein
MKCPLCGLKFSENEAEKACCGCPFVKNCNLIRCPNCGYEIPSEPEFIKKIKKWRKRKNERREY